MRDLKSLLRLKWNPDSGNLSDLRRKIETFQSLLDHNNRTLGLIADAEEKLSGDFLFDTQYLKWLVKQLEESVGEMVLDLNFITDNHFVDLINAFETVRRRIAYNLESKLTVRETPFVFAMDEIGMESSDAVGEKMARLGEIRNKLKYNVPEGFVLSAYACWKFLTARNIFPRIAELAQAQSATAEDIERELVNSVKSARILKGVHKVLLQRTSQLNRKSKNGHLFAVRSSAVGEDGELSFAGIHDSVLGVRVSDTPAAYLDVIASLFNARAIEYRQKKREPLEAALMAVGVMRMIPATASGVAYSFDPGNAESDTIIVEAAYGLGKMVVEGKGHVDRFEISRKSPYPILHRDIRVKREKYVLRPDGGVELADVASGIQDMPSVSDEFLAVLTAALLRIEKFMKAPVDIEWAQNEEGALVILQARPLRFSHKPAEVREVVPEEVRQRNVLIAHRGVISCRGIAHGHVVVVKGRTQGNELPEDSIIVAGDSSPQLAELLSEANAIITETGSATGHLATIAREYRVPSLMGVKDATQILRDGMEITVDAEENVIYKGRIDELLRYQCHQNSSFEDGREFRILRRILNSVSPLNLKNRWQKDFTPQACQTYHDIVRFAHEKAVEFLISGFADRRFGKGLVCTRVDVDIPIDLQVLDVGGGLRDESNHPTCNVEEVTCVPLKALLDGLAAPGAWSTEPTNIDFGSFMSSATGNPASQMQSAAIENNLAIISDRYLNLNLHLGYHFNQVVAYVSGTKSDNHIYFRFAGGMTNITRRSRRARMISLILEDQDFVVETQADLIIARLKDFDTPVILDRLTMIGFLIGFTRQMDVMMRSDSSVEQGVNQFLTRYGRKGGYP